MLKIMLNVAYGLENQRMPKDDIRKRVLDLLELVGMPEHTEKYTRQSHPDPLASLMGRHLQGFPGNKFTSRRAFRRICQSRFSM